MAKILSYWEVRLGEVDSPIERFFLNKFCSMAVERGFDVGRRKKEQRIVVKPQRWIGSYRVDFLVEFSILGHQLAIVVECDGHRFHERTKEQAARDKKRDRTLQRAGYEVLHFTGSELWNSLSECTREVLDLIEQFQTTVIFEVEMPQARGVA